MEFRREQIAADIRPYALAQMSATWKLCYGKNNFHLWKKASQERAMLFVNQANFPAEHEVRTNICHHRETENDKKTDSTPAPGKSIAMM